MLSIKLMMAEENPTIRRMREELNCAVCHDLFDTPKTLHCFHTFCLKCIEASEKSRRRMRGKGDSENKVECPVCQESSEYPGGTKNVTTNFVYVKLVEHLNVHEKLTSGGSLECGKCQKTGNDSAVLAYCYDCQAPLCEFCSRMHKQTVELARHHVCTLEEIKLGDHPPSFNLPSSSPSEEALYVCSKHKEPLKLYCFNCQEVICRDCTVTKKEHRDHSFEFISDVIEGERAGLLEYLAPLEDMKGRFIKCSNLVRAQQEELRVKKERRTAVIDSVIEEALKLVESRRGKLHQMAQDFYDGKSKNLDLQLEDVDAVKGSITSMTDFVQTTLEKGSSVEVMLHKKQIKSRSETLRQRYLTYESFEVGGDDESRFVYDLKPIRNFGGLCDVPCVARSEAMGEGLEHPMQGEATTFVVMAKDKHGKPLPHGGGACTASITASPASRGRREVVTNTLNDNSDGTYTVSYRPQFPGVNKVSVRFDDQDINGSPYEVNVARNYSRPIGEPHAFPIPNASPWGLAMLSDTEMVVTASDYMVHIYNINGEELGLVNSDFIRPYGIATDHEGNLWITDRESHMVQKFQRNEKGEFVKIHQFGSRGVNPGQFSHPRGIAVNPDNGFIYISDMKNNRIQIFDEECNYKDQFGSPGKTEGLFNLPAGLCFNKEGKLVVCDDHNCRLQVFDGEGSFVETLGTTPGQKGLLCSPIGIATDFHGRYVITEFGSHCVTFLSAEGDILNCVRSIGKGYGHFVHPRGIALDSAGYVYVADNENMRVTRF